MKALEIYCNIRRKKIRDNEGPRETVRRWEERIEAGVELLKATESYEEYVALNDLINADIDNLKHLRRKARHEDKVWFKEMRDRPIDDDEIAIVVIKNGCIPGHKIF